MRNDRAKDIGKPPYVLLTNRQVAVIAEQRPESLADLAKVKGGGDSRLKDFGVELLEVVGLADVGEITADGA